MDHKYQVGQRVRIAKQRFSAAATETADSYEVVRLMPSNWSGDVGYVIKFGDLERSVRQSEIVPAKP